jgi:signal transduction histidine kinase
MLVFTLGGATVALVAVAFFTATNRRMRADVAQSTQAVMQEQRIANAIVGGVMRQLVTVSSVTVLSDSGFRSEFDVAGAIVYEGLRTYLFRDLAPGERIQIERVKEHHEQLEVSAVRAAQLVARRDAVRVDEARHEVMAYGVALMRELEGFLRMREEGVQELARDQEATFRQLRLVGMGTALLFVVVLPVLLAQFLHRRVSRPLGALAEAATRIGQGQLGTRVPAHFDREIEVLAQSFNQMAERLADAQAEIVQAEKLGAVGRMTAGIAHELNNPLTSVLGFSELLATDLREGKVMTPERAAEYVDPIVREATRARLLIRNLLQFSRRDDTVVGAVPLRAAVDVARDLRQHAFQHAGLHLEVGTIPDVAVTGEQQQLENVFLNIMNNALYAMSGQARGILRVSAELDDGMVRVVFDDNGPGLAQPDRVFEPFYTTKDVGEGTGLGLAVSQRSIEGFGGSLHGENRPEGGARFVVRLPVVPMPAVEAPAPSPRPPVEPMPGGRTVLVVEDEPHLQVLSSRLLARLGVRVLMASSAAQAREFLARETVDAVISDVKMPGESGVTLYEWIKAEHPALAERFLFVTGDTHASELAAFAEERPGALILKPFELEDYLRRVRAVLEVRAPA